MKRSCLSLGSLARLPSCATKVTLDWKLFTGNSHNNHNMFFISRQYLCELIAKPVFMSIYSVHAFKMLSYGAASHATYDWIVQFYSFFKSLPFIYMFYFCIVFKNVRPGYMESILGLFINILKRFWPFEFNLYLNLCCMKHVR